VLIGLGGLCAPLWLRRRATTIVYAITDQRVITIDGRRSRTVRSFLPQDITDLRRVEHPDGSGDLVLRTEWGAGRSGARGGRGRPAATPRRFARPGQRPMVHHPQVAFEPNYMQHLVPIHRRNVAHPATPASGLTLKRLDLAPRPIHPTSRV
jgi:hypothetical protein